MVQLQEVEWDPIISWFNTRFDVSIEKSKQMDIPPVKDKDKIKLTKYLMSHSFAAINGSLINSVLESETNVMKESCTLDRAMFDYCRTTN